jgi:hypothetical protein
MDLDDVFDRTLDIAHTIFGEGAVFLASTGLMFAAGVLLYDCGRWLLTGNWETVTLFPLVAEFLSYETVSWLLQPESWIGLAKLIRGWLHISASISLTVASIAVLVVGVGIAGAIVNFRLSLDDNRSE